MKRIAAALICSGAILLLTERCAYNDSNVVVDCDRSDLALSLGSLENSTSCKTVNGKIKVNTVGGVPPYSFSINNGAYQLDSTFMDLGPGTYTVGLKDNVNCSRTLTVLITEEESDLAASAVATADNRCAANNGSIAVTVSGGRPPYHFSLNNGEYRTSPAFTDLGGGTYNIKVRDDDNCSRSLNVEVITEEPTLVASAVATADNQCATNDGSITVMVTGGKPPYQYQLNAMTPALSNVFASLSNGTYTVSVKDAEDCQASVSIQVPRGATGTSYVNDIKPILDVNCNFSGCHGPGNGNRDWTNFNNVKEYASRIKTRTGTRSMPPIGELTQDQINMIACWVDDGALSN